MSVKLRARKHIHNTTPCHKNGGRESALIRYIPAVLLLETELGARYRLVIPRLTQRCMHISTNLPLCEGVAGREGQRTALCHGTGERSRSESDRSIDRTVSVHGRASEAQYRRNE